MRQRHALVLILVLAGVGQAQAPTSRWTTVTDSAAPVQVALDYDGARHASWLSSDHGTLFVWVRVTQDGRATTSRLAVKCGDHEVSYGQESGHDVMVPVGAAVVVAHETRLVFDVPAPDSWEEIAMRAACGHKYPQRQEPAPTPKPF